MKISYGGYSYKFHRMVIFQRCTVPKTQGISNMKFIPTESTAMSLT